jgi:hypothetical protein
MRTLLPILGVALLVGLLALTGSAAAAPDTSAETTTNNEAVNETVTVAGENVTVKAGADEGDAGAFAFASAGADEGEDGSGAVGGARVANEYGGLHAEGYSEADVTGTGIDVGQGRDPRTGGRPTEVFIGIPGQNPFYSVSAGGGVSAFGSNVGAGVGCYGFYTSPPPQPQCST